MCVVVQAFERIVYRMNDVRKRISEVRLQFILTIDEHTQITNVRASHTHYNS